MLVVAQTALVLMASEGLRRRVRKRLKKKMRMLDFSNQKGAKKGSGKLICVASLVFHVSEGSRKKFRLTQVLIVERLVVLLLDGDLLSGDLGNADERVQLLNEGILVVGGPGGGQPGEGETRLEALNKLEWGKASIISQTIVH